MEARCTSRSHGKLEFSGNLPQWHGAMTVFELHQVQASHVSHFNIFDGRRLPVREGHRTERLAQRFRMLTPIYVLLTSACCATRN